MHIIIICKYEKDRMKNSREKMVTLFFAIITLSVAMETSGLIWPNLELIQALMYVIIICSMKRIPSRTTEKKWQRRFLNYNTICCHGNQWSDLAELRTHPSLFACPHCLQE